MAKVTTFWNPGFWANKTVSDGGTTPTDPDGSGICPSGACGVGLSLEEKQTLFQVQCIIKSRGSILYLNLDDDQTIERDEFGSIKKRTEAPAKPIYGNPIIFSPNQKQKDRNGIRENVQVLVTTPMQCWLDHGFSDKDLSHIDSIRATIVLRGQTYEIRDKSLQGQFGSTFLYVVLGLNRK